MPDFLSEYILLKKTKSLKYFEENIEKLNSWAGLGQVPEQPKPIIEKTWEKPVIKGNNDFIIGFIDMEVR